MLDALISMVIQNPAVAGIVSAAVVAVVVLGVRVAKVTKNTYDDSIFGFLAKVLGISSGESAAKPSDPAAGASAPLIRERPESGPRRLDDQE